MPAPEPDSVSDASSDCDDTPKARQVGLPDGYVVERRVAKSRTYAVVKGPGGIVTDSSGWQLCQHRAPCDCRRGSNVALLEEILICDLWNRHVVGLREKFGPPAQCLEQRFPGSLEQHRYSRLKFGFLASSAINWVSGRRASVSDWKKRERFRPDYSSS